MTLELEGLAVTELAKPDEVALEIMVFEVEEVELVEVELVIFGTPIIASSLTPRLSLQHVDLESVAQHQLPSLHCDNGTLSDALPPFYIAIRS